MKQPNGVKKRCRVPMREERPCEGRTDPRTADSNPEIHLGSPRDPELIPPRCCHSRYSLAHLLFARRYGPALGRLKAVTAGVLAGSCVHRFRHRWHEIGGGGRVPLSFGTQFVYIELTCKFYIEPVCRTLPPPMSTGYSTDTWSGLRCFHFCSVQTKSGTFRSNTIFQPDRHGAVF